MRKVGGGVIVHTASKAGVVGEPGHVAYSASKGAVIALTRAMAIELAPDHIRVNSVCPGPTHTDMLTGIFPDEADIRRLGESAPLGRVGRPEDIAAAVAYLASSDTDWCTGQAISIDGGMSILK
jgi:NAD(P)-dependent dehydrogenase (short-subunit alcohol dehydrogenase family)